MRERVPIIDRPADPLDALLRACIKAAKGDALVRRWFVKMRNSGDRASEPARPRASRAKQRRCRAGT